MTDAKLETTISVDLDEARSLLPNVMIDYPVLEDNPYLVHLALKPKDGMLYSCKMIDNWFWIRNVCWRIVQV
jgi:hypothetical protein